MNIRPTCDGANNLGTMSVRRENRQNVGSCNYCSHSREYRYVFVVEAMGTSTRICSDCLNTLKQLTRNLDA